ncbi:ATP-dependent helicase [Aspergillus clavatus NRRL 1]|uniref:DNA 3'-5' helicase n=1 Tax=Aspergillus clavatus (strain ATCC 1007 / CBS 513.65 / DSM 816 / NCTC 3887 / NRRL 1 / QM 1276 / 107) TaxID=344612 RepID=A1CER9_ASPCL|nr:ATP-depentend DNA helicase, putative [Aspergillus clavatus NRRL 1]EAW11368.1 ATP-depentend DNA helicase, putative [Aspergillus clavatus NRRL 1]
MDSILDGLNTAQKTAVTSPAHILQVLAPPGSGKTKTLTSRVAYLLSHYGYQPQDVICCTFTIKASREMRERLARLIGDEVQSKLVLGTFHSICRRYLVTYGYLIGLRRGFGIADSGDSLAIIKRILKRLRCSIQPNAARARISHQKAHGISPAEAAAKYSRGAAKSTENHEFVQVYQEYEIYLATSNLLDYDDLLLRCADLLRRHPECVSNVQAVLVDEFQDTNHIQYELMNLFASQNRRITVVGDPDQSIYGFRSAEIKNLGRMQQRYKDTSVILLEDNYRSSGSILSSAQDVIEQDSSRPAKKLQPTHCLGTMPVLRKLPTAEAEAQWMVLEIKRCIAMTGKLLDYSDFAILLRSAALSRHIESEMGKQGVPYKMVGGLRFFDRIEIKVLLDYLRVISNPGNSDALLRIINVPARKIGEESVKMLMSSAEAAKTTLWNFVRDVAQGRRSTEKSLSKPTDQGLCTLVGIIESSREKLLECTDSSAPRKLLEFVIKKLNFRDYLTAMYSQNEENRWANVEELLSQAGDASIEESVNDHDDSLPEIQGLTQQEAHRGEESLSRFLANVALSTEIVSEEGDQPQAKVTISTIHAAKGLEWPVVFVPAVYNGIIPHSRAEDSDEERRLLYVAMTRAQALLYLSYPLKQSRSEESTTSVTSFLPQKIIERRFRSLGPSLQEKIVYGIADILRRPRPSIESMLAAHESLPSLRDDQWTADGQEAPDAVIRWDGSRAFGEEPDSKRRRHNHEQSSTSTITTTYMSSSTYSMTSCQFPAPTTMSLGFSTAREYINTAPVPEAVQPAGVKTDSKTKTHAAVAVGRKAVGLSQGNISRFFGQSLAEIKDSKESERKTNRQAQIGSRGLAGHPGQASSSNSAFKSAIPARFSSHRPQTQRFRPPRPMLESSGANEYNWLATSSRRTETGPPSGGQENQEAPNVKQGAVTEHGTDGNKKTLGQTSDIRPVTTFHTTTMSMVQQTGRRTLGVRRSMNDGWADRWKKAGNGQS